MKDCSPKQATHQRTGTSQNERFPAALKPDSFLIDERNETDNIEVAQTIANYVKFFNDQNEENGSWEPFFFTESTSILVSLFLWDIKQLREGYNEVVRKIKNLSDNDYLLREYFESIHHQLDYLNKRIAYLDEAIPAKEYLIKTSDAIYRQLNIIFQSIDESAGDIRELTQKYIFQKNVQQLFGMLQNWKDSSGKSLEMMLDSYSGHKPHFTLFLTFLKLLGIAREDVNGFTKKHLDFYYKDVLRLQPLVARPDYVHLIAQPAVNIKNQLLPKGTVFLAGKNDLGQNRYYASTADHFVNNIKLKFFFTAYINKDLERRQADLTGINGKGLPFNVFPNPNPDSLYVPYDYATEAGIMIASPLLYLSGGNRYIKIDITNTLTGEQEINVMNASDYKYYLTGEEGVIEVKPPLIAAPGTVGEMYLYLPPEEKKIIGYDAALHPEIKVQTSYPVLKIVPLKNINPIVLDSASVGVTVKVRNLRDLVLATDNGIIDISKPFQPFGEYPNLGNGFVIGCNEFFLKNRAVLNVRSDSKAGVTVYKMNSNGWVSPSYSLDSEIVNTYPVREYSDENEAPENTSIAGYIRVELTDPAYSDDNTVLKTEIVKDRVIVTTTPAPVIKYLYLDYDVTDTTYQPDNIIDVYEVLPFGYQKEKLKVLLPNPRLIRNTLTLADRTLGSRISTGLTLLQSTKVIKPVEAEQKAVYTPEDSGGSLYLAFENATPGSSFSVLVQLAEGTINPTKDPAVISWEYLKLNNKWEKFKSYELADATNGLLRSGLVTFTVPEDIATTGTTILPDGSMWIKITVTTTDAICDFIGVHEQALQAVLTEFDNSGGGTFISNISKDTISKLYQPVNFVKKIIQPYASFGGSRKEEDSMLYQRTNERLRHKNRAITLWDYERLILQNYPEVVRVKCLNHYRYGSKCGNVSAGYITIVPIARWSKSSIIYLKPLVSLQTMSGIKSFVGGLGSPHARLLVKPPSLEKIKLKFSVKYREYPGADTRVFEIQLTEAINKYLSPWAYDEDKLEFSSSIEISSLIEVIDDLPFVDYITDFKVDQLVPTDQEGTTYKLFSNVKKIVPDTDYTLFIPDASHDIKKI